MKKSALISECGNYRYSLSRIWDESLPKLLFIMLNPSTADADNDDPTIRRCIGFAKGWGYGGIVVGNLYAWRSTNPMKLIFEASIGTDIVGPDNDKYLQEMSAQSSEIVFAWGSHGDITNRNEIVSSMFKSAKCIKKTKHGQPCHPLYLPSTLKLITYKEENKAK